MELRKIICFITLSCVALLANGQKSAQFNNPILGGFYPDPSICRVGNDYYLVNSTFAYYPGIPIFHSKDLVNWTQIGHVLDRPEQLDLEGLGVSRGIFAPAIRYHDGLFYVTCTVVDGKGNFIVTAANPSGPWSNPIYLPEVEGIDPSMFFDDNGKSYIVYNSDAPDKKPLYQGHRTIKMFEYDIRRQKVIGKLKTLVNGGSDFAKKPIWVEGPHIFKREDYYYLIAAEGGTEEGHSEVVFRSREVWGPYESYEQNPILTQRNLPSDREHPITSTGHADFVQTTQGDWWSVFLGCRPYEDDHYNTGRETFMAPVQWENGWPIVKLGGEVVKYQYPSPYGVEQQENFKYSGNFSFKEDFDNRELAFHWTFLRTVKDKWYSLTTKAGALTLNTRATTCSENGNPSFIAHRQQHLKNEVSTQLDYNADTPYEKAGLVIFQNETHYYFLCKGEKNGQQMVQLFKSSDKEPILMAEQPVKNNTPVRLKIVANSNRYDFHYALDQNKWLVLFEGADGKFLSTKTAGGFVGSMYAMYTTSNGELSDNQAHFEWFQYEGKDDAFK